MNNERLNAEATNESGHTSEHNAEQVASEPTRKVQNLFIGLAEDVLDDDTELKQAVIDFYSDTERLDKEMRSVFAGMSNAEANQQVEQLAARFEDETEFRNYVADHIEVFQGTTERANAMKRIETRIKNEPVASQEEYELGVYRDALESQVADAVFILKDKGYFSFESGMAENPSSRSQFIGFYNKNITVPTSLIDAFAERGFKVEVEKLEDRVQLRLTPLEDRPLRLSEWKSVWLDLAREMPEIEEESFDDMKTFTNHQEFRDYQDELRLRTQRDQ